MAGGDRCTQHGGPRPQARTTNCVSFFNLYLKNFKFIYFEKEHEKGGTERENPE